jgi:hypothetical protein
MHLYPLKMVDVWTPAETTPFLNLWQYIGVIYQCEALRESGCWYPRASQKGGRAGKDNGGEKTPTRREQYSSFGT